MRLTVLYDDGCGLCRRFGAWLDHQALLVELDLVPAGSVAAQRRFPALDHARTLEEITVVSDGTTRQSMRGGDYPDDCVGTCAPNPQG